MIKTITPLILTILIVLLGIEAAIDQIWLSPTEVTPLMDAGFVNAPDYADAPKGVWTNITTGVSSRINKPIVQIDSNGLIWIVSGFSDAYWMNAVWNYDPKTDLYRWVAGNVDNPNADSVVYGEFGIPSADAFPGGQIAFAASTIDRDDNIWFCGSAYGTGYDFWRLNTTSIEFTYFSVKSSEDNALVFTDRGVPSPLNYPGYIEGAILAVDSQNNLWLVGGSNSLFSATSAIWHFNSTSLEWTWMLGSFNTTEAINFQNNFMGGRWAAGGFIDYDDRIWMFGGYGPTLNSAEQAEWGDMWSFDTKTLQWRVEWGSIASLINPSTVVSDDFHSGNIPAARVGAQLVDRLDGTLMIVGGYRYHLQLMLNDIWLYNKTSKMWKMVYGELSGGNFPSNYTNYRQVGGQMGSRKYYGAPSGPNNRGHFIIYGGLNSLTPLNDIWIIPQDPCVLCDVNADCNAADIWSHTCTCQQGYSGDGKTCTADVVPVAPVAVPVSDNIPVSDNGPVTKAPQSKSTSDAFAPASFRLSTTFIILAILVAVN